MKKNGSKKQESQSSTVFSNQDTLNSTQFMSAAVVHHNAERFAEAVTLYRTVLHITPQAVDAHFNLAMILLHKRNDSTAALAHLQQALLIEPKIPRLWIAYAESLIISGQAETAWIILCDANKQGVDKTALADISAQVAAAIAHSHLLKSRWVQAADWAKTGLAIAPNNGKLWHFLGGSLLQSGDTIAADTALQTAVTLLPEDAEAWDHLGLVKTALAQYEQANSAFQQSVKFSPARALTWSNAAVNADKANNPHQALQFAEEALLRNPLLDKAYAIKARSFSLGGELEPAFESLQKAIALAISNPVEIQTDIKHMSVTHASQALLDARACFAAADIPFFLCAGTLLGIIRDGKLLEFDKDMDVALSADINRQRAIDALTHSDQFMLSQVYTDEELKWNFSVVHIASGIGLDLFFYHRDDDHYLSGFHKLPYPILNRLRGFMTESIQWQGLDWQVPSPPEQYLCDIYGQDWLKPDPYFDTVISSHSAALSSIQGRRCHGYFKLYNHLKNGQWRHAIHYCQQLNHLYADIFIMDCLAKITQIELTRKSEDTGCSQCP